MCLIFLAKNKDRPLHFSKSYRYHFNGPTIPDSWLFLGVGDSLNYISLRYLHKYLHSRYLMFLVKISNKLVLQTICLHLVDFMASVGKYTIHGSYGLFKKTSAGRVRRRGTALTSQRQQRKPLHVSWQFAKTVLNLYA